jgi:hypothetical protein
VYSYLEIFQSLNLLVAGWKTGICLSVTTDPYVFTTNSGKV